VHHGDESASISDITTHSRRRRRDLARTDLCEEGRNTGTAMLNMSDLLLIHLYSFRGPLKA